MATHNAVTRLSLGDGPRCAHTGPFASGFSLQPPACAPKPQGCGGGIYLGNQPSTSLAKKAPQDREASRGGRAGLAGAQAQEPLGAGTLLGAGAALGWAGLCSPRAAVFFFLPRERLPWVTRLRGDTVLPSLQVATYRSARLITPSAAPLTRFALPAAGRADLRWRHLLGGGSVRTPPQLRPGLFGWWKSP